MIVMPYDLHCALFLNRGGKRVSIKIDVREIDPFSLPTLPLEDSLNLPDVHAIYFALSKNNKRFSIFCVPITWGKDGIHIIDLHHLRIPVE